MQDGVVIDAMVGALTDPFDSCHMGVTAENVATDYGVSRTDQDTLAAESHRRAAAASDAGYFTEQITPVEVKGRKGTVTVDADEHIRAGVTADDLAKLRPSFAADGTVTPGNASGINDAAVAVVIASGSFAAERGCARSGGWSPTATPGLSRGSWVWAPCPPPAKYSTGRVSNSTRSTCSR
jgi:acetyl-CoA C-acetyltransferase